MWGRRSEGIDDYCVRVAVLGDGGVTGEKQQVKKEGKNAFYLVDVAPNCTVFQAFDRISPLKT